MVAILQVITSILVVVAMVPALAHALELPGKLRLTKDAYLAVQPIYYPGFTIAGLAEPAAIVSALVLLIVTPRGGADFWLTLVALLGLVGMHAVYWIVTHPVNKLWLQGEELSGAGERFFSVASSRRRGGEARPVDWRDLRDRWEYSHVARAALAALSFVVLLIATSSDGGR